MTDEPKRPALVAPSLRSLQILQLVAQQSAPLTASEINAVLGLPKATIHRMVGTLEKEGFLARDLDGRRYLPGPKLRDMMLGVMRAGSYLAPRRAVLTRLAEAIGETCNLSIHDVDAMIYLDRVETKWPLRIALTVGSRVPLHATAAGKVALAFMAEADFAAYLSKARLPKHTPATITDPAALRAEIARVRERGHSCDAEEFVPGMNAVAVPVTDRTGRLYATLSFHAPLQRLTLEKGLMHLPTLRAAAEDLGDLV